MKKLLLLCLITITACASDEKLTGKCIILDGPSSAGKSTLARHLVDILPDTWEIEHHSLYVSQAVEKSKHIGLVPLDYIYEGTPQLFKEIRTTIISCKNVEEKQTKEQAWQAIYRSWKQAHYETVARKLETGTNIILDISLFKKEELELAQNALKSHNPYFAFVHVPFDKLVERVHKRNTQGDPKEFRYLNQVMHQYACCYLAHKTKTPQCIEKLYTDTIQKTVDTYAPHHTDAMSAFLPTGDMLVQEVCTIMNITEAQKSYITPRLAHDITINTHTHTPHQASTLIRYDFWLSLNNQKISNAKRNTFVSNTSDLLYYKK